MRKETIISIIILIIILIFGIIILNKAVSKQEKVECLKWQNESKELEPYNAYNKTGYYLLKWQKDQCDARGIEISAPVINE